MICKPCSIAGENNRKGVGLVGSLHAECRGKTHCDCQHKVGPSSKFIQEKANKADEKD